MTSINSPHDFAEALQSERAVVFVCFPRSKQAGRSRQVVEKWEAGLAAHNGKPDFPVYQLEPDGHSYTWKWVRATVGEIEECADAPGLVLWLRRGSVVGRVRNAALAGVKTLNAMTGNGFDLESGAGGPALPASQPPPFDAGLLDVLCCPETRQELKLVPAAILEKLEPLLADGRLKNRAGRVLKEKIDGGLIRADGKYLYPLRQGIPILLVDEAIPLTDRG